MGERCACQIDAGGGGDVGLHGKIVPVVVFHAGGRLYLDHVPAEVVTAGLGKHDVGESQSTVDTDGCLEERGGGAL